MKHEVVILVGVSLRREPAPTDDHLNELQKLCCTAGLQPCVRLHQRVHKYSSATLLGKGKLQQIHDLVAEHKATAVLFDHALTGSQIRNLEKILGVPIITRSQLILNIFAQRAHTREGKLQVELAQLLDDLPRQIGGWHGSLSRLAGGIGTRGPGEAALESDRRRIREKIKLIERKLKGVRAHRERLRRPRAHLPSLALIGYTSSGKSTLLNKLTGARVLTHDKLFATLDPTTRKLQLPPPPEQASWHPSIDVTLTDTVGFLNRLPTHLIEAFKATLEESQYADILLHVIDVANPLCYEQAKVVQDLVTSLGWSDKQIILVLNKCDKLSMPRSRDVYTRPIGRLVREHNENCVFVSAHTGEGLHELKHKLRNCVRELP